MDLSGALEIASCTDSGMVRSHNEDSIASDGDQGLVVLADGMGGYNAGEVASGMATTVIITELQIGMVRSHNEDSIASDGDQGLVVLADGMGGYNAGEVASGMATTVLVTEIQQLLEQQKPFQLDEQTGQPFAQRLLREQIAKANTSIYQAAQSQPQYAGMGTTLVVALFYDNRATVAHIGDSRLYRLRGDEFRQITKDHSLLQEQIDSGMITPQQAKLSQNKNLVTRALGIDPVVEAEIHEYETLPDDIYLLCS